MYGSMCGEGFVCTFAETVDLLVHCLELLVHCVLPASLLAVGCVQLERSLALLHQRLQTHSLQLP